MSTAEANVNSTTTGTGPLAVLVSGGLDSAILLGEMVRARPVVFPLYVRSGLLWEPIEREHLERFLRALASNVLQPLAVLALPVSDVYPGDHWSLSGREVPGSDTPDDAVYLPGRNVLLLSKALLWCHLRGVPELALAPLGSNPFPDATPEFFRAFEAVVNQAMSGTVRIRLPYLGLHKVEVMRRGQGLPLELTFSCLRPIDHRHCGACNKCAERRQGFRDAGMRDATKYAS